MVDNTTWTNYIMGAERAWLNVFDSGKKSRFLSPDGAPMRLLPVRFNSRRKIYTYFRQWWGPRFSERMLCNLPLHEHRGRLYVISYDIPPFSLLVKEVRVVSVKEGEVVSDTVVDEGPEGRIHIKHIARKHPLSKRYMIVYRNDTEADFRYQDRYRLCEE